MKIHLLNHASVIIETGPIKLLTDPWFWGTCFAEGWGLRYANPRALEEACSCTHLWVSHFHSDHFHLPTLEAIAKRRPDIVVLGNRSLNFQLDEALGGLGFRNVIPLEERRAVALDDSVEVERFPATGIDNMLLMRSPEGLLLNYNDCVLPPSSRRRLARRFGSVDVLLCNFNHAGKLLKHPVPPAEEVKQALLDNLMGNVECFEPAWALPFASHHYYRARENLHQNESMLKPAELADLDPRVIALEVGQSLDFPGSDLRSPPRVLGEGCPDAPFEVLERKQGSTLEELATAAQHYRRTLRRAYGPATRLLPPLRIRISDLDREVRFDSRRGLDADGEPSGRPHIVAHSEALRAWFSAPYGTDAFVVGAHFELSDSEVLPFKWLIIFGLLAENRLDLRSLLRMLATPRGWRFLLNRREEILGILTSGRIGADYHR